ncbi:MAG: hypothetical protein V3R64_02185 [Sphingomonadales bacterium]
MAEDKKSKIIEGEILDEKPTPKKAGQYVSEKMVGLVLLVVVLIIVGFYAYNPVRGWISSFGKTAVEEPAAQAQTDENDDEISELKERLRVLENQPTPKEPPDLEERFQKIDETLSTLQKTSSDGQQGAAGPDPRIEILIQEVEALKAELEKRPTVAALPDATFAKALAALSPPLYQALPYEGQLEQVRILALEMPALSQTTLSEPLSILSGFAKTGVPSQLELNKAFERASIEALKVEGLASDAGWWDKTWARIKGLVVVRRTDGAGGTALDMTLFEIEKHLEEGDLKGAMELVSALLAGEGDAFVIWLDQAAKREKALEAFAALVNFIPMSSPTGGGN